jgi:hypothetical protein
MAKAGALKRGKNSACLALYMSALEGSCNFVRSSTTCGPATTKPTATTVSPSAPSPTRPSNKDEPVGDLVSDPKFSREIGVSLVTVWRRDQAPPDGWPEKIPVGNRNFRLRRQVEFYKRLLLQRARDARE